jgi:hypothetical protein
MNDGRYVGMLVRGSGETFNLIVPVRRMIKWAKKRDIEWAMDATKPVPTIEDIKRIEPEDAEMDHNARGTIPKSLFPFLIRTMEKSKVKPIND